MKKCYIDLQYVLAVIMVSKNEIDMNNIICSTVLSIVHSIYFMIYQKMTNSSDFMINLLKQSYIAAS